MLNKPEIYIDGLNVFMRHFAANPAKSLNGQLCGGIFGMLRNIQHLTEKFKPGKLIVVWEGGGSVRRRNIDPNYKQGKRPVRLNRSEYNEDIPDTVENRDWQLKTLVKILYKTPVTQIYINDCEADDVIAYLTAAKNSAENKVIVTSDKDYYQLINDQVKIWSPNKKLLIDEKYVLNNWGVTPQNFCTTRCFTGDQSDGIKGVKGAGFKVMAKRFPDLSTCKDVSTNDIIIMAKLESKNGSKLKLFESIINESENINKNWKLMYLNSYMISACQVKKINYQLENKEATVNKFELLKLLNKQGLNSFDIHTFLLSIKSSIRTQI
jgi:DNA polymerase-1